MNNLEKEVKKTQQEDLPCILCGTPTRNRGVFVPDNPAEFGLGNPPSGKQRAAIYALCESHPSGQEILSEIERHIKEDRNNSLGLNWV